MSGDGNRRAIETVPVIDALDAVSKELRLLADEGLEFQATIAAILKSVGPDKPDAIYKLQGLDRATQTIEALAEYTKSLSLLIESSWRVDATAAAGKLKLNTLAQRLALKDENASCDDQEEDDLCGCIFL